MMTNLHQVGTWINSVAVTAICIQAQTANVLTRCLRFRTWRLPFETEAIQMRKYAN